MLPAGLFEGVRNCDRSAVVAAFDVGAGGDFGVAEVGVTFVQFDFRVDLGVVEHAATQE